INEGFSAFAAHRSENRFCAIALLSDGDVITALDGLTGIELDTATHFPSRRFTSFDRCLECLIAADCHCDGTLWTCAFEHDRARACRVCMMRIFKMPRSSYSRLPVPQRSFESEIDDSAKRPAVLDIHHDDKAGYVSIPRVRGADHAAYMKVSN